jgi:hypothetical protein
MGMADMAVALWGDHLRFNPANPHWFDRDRFVLSNGHASMMLYAVLHLTGYDLPMSEIRNFRQLHSKTPGHPEHGLTPGVVRGLGVIRVALERIRSAVKRAGEADGAQNVDYLAGTLKMIDLDGPKVIPGLLGRALIAAEDPPLRRVLSVLLRRPGFETEIFESIEELTARLTEEPVPTVVVVAGSSSGNTDPLGVTAPGAVRPWTLVTFSAPGSAGALSRVSDLALHLPFDPATVATLVVQAVEARQR